MNHKKARRLGIKPDRVRELIGQIEKQEYKNSIIGELRK